MKYLCTVYKTKTVPEITKSTEEMVSNYRKMKLKKLRMPIIFQLWDFSIPNWHIK